jgi:hypothetical protein
MFAMNAQLVLIRSLQVRACRKIAYISFAHQRRQGLIGSVATQAQALAPPALAAHSRRIQVPHPEAAN